MSITADPISWFHTPAGYSGPSGSERTTHTVQEWLDNEGEKAGVLKRASRGTYAGLVTFALGLVGNYFSHKNDNPILKWGSILLAGIGAGTAIVGEAFGTVRNKILFNPPKATPEEIAEVESKVENFTKIKVKNKDCTLTGYHLEAPEKTNKTILYLHGRGQHNGDCLPTCDKLRTHSGANVLVMDYRGFGESEGNPSDVGLIEDAREMYKYLESDGIDTEDITIFGHSLGGGIGIQLTKLLENEGKTVPKLIIQSSFATPTDVASKYSGKIFPKWFVEKLAGKTFNSLGTINDISKDTEIVIAHGEDDEYIEYDQSVKLYGKVSDRVNTSFVLIPECKHSDFDKFFDKNEKFAQSISVT